MTEKELKRFSYKNHKEACLYFWPDLNGEILKGWVLHHKDPTLKTIDIIRYYEWRVEDLEPMTLNEHASLHRKLEWNDPSKKNARIALMKSEDYHNALSKVKRKDAKISVSQKEDLRHLKNCGLMMNTEIKLFLNKKKLKLTLNLKSISLKFFMK